MMTSARWKPRSVSLESGNAICQGAPKKIQALHRTHEMRDHACDPGEGIELFQIL